MPFKYGYVRLLFLSCINLFMNYYVNCNVLYIFFFEYLIVFLGITLWQYKNEVLRVYIMFKIFLYLFIQSDPSVIMARILIYVSAVNLIKMIIRKAFIIERHLKKDP